MKTWIKGGIILVLVILTISIIGSFFADPGYKLNLMGLIFLFPSLLFGFILFFSIYGYETPNISPIIFFIEILFSVFVYFIIGALIGWLVGKYQNKNN